MKQELVSVIVTLYNYRRFIRENIESVLGQTYKHVELVIVDDASADNPYPKIKKFGKSIRYFRHDTNLGYAAAKNTGIVNSTGEILAMLDADDILTQDSIEVRIIQMQNSFDFVHGRAIIFKEGKPSSEKLDTFFHKRWISGYQPVWKSIHAQSVMLRKDVHRQIGLYDEQMRCKADREMWARICNHGFRIGYVDHPVCKYRAHVGQMSRSDWKLANLEDIERDFEGRVARRARAIDFSEIRKLD